MSIEDAQRRVVEQVKAAVIARYGERFYDEVLTGHLLAQSVDWFTPYLFGNGSRKASLPLSPMGELAEVTKGFAAQMKRPVLEVECGLGTVGASLKVESAIDRDPARIEVARASFPESAIAHGTIDKVPGDGTYGTVMSAFGLGRIATGGATPIFLEFVTHATRLLKAGGLVMVAERARFQDNLVEPLVAHDYEILKISALAGTNSVLIVAQKG